MKKDYKIAVAGTGYVGLSIATLLSQHHQVTAVDIIPEKVDMINNRKSHGGLDDHNGIRVVLHDQLDHSLNRRCVEMLRVTVVVRRGRYNNKVRIRVCSLCIQCCGQVQFFFCEILLDIVILNRRLTVVDHLAVDFVLHYYLFPLLVLLCACDRHFFLPAKTLRFLTRSVFA